MTIDNGEHYQWQTHFGRKPLIPRCLSNAGKDPSAQSCA